MKRVFQYGSVILFAAGIILLMAAYSRMSARPADEGADPAADSLAGALPQVIRSFPLDRPFTFAGELVPLDNFDVRERLDRELIINSYRHSTTILNIKNAYKYFPVIEPILQKNGIPDDFKYLAVAESDLMNAVSSAGARGIWQFMGSIAEHYGLEISRDVDERYHVEKATQAACEYLLDTKRRFGSWTLAAASYNMGGTRLAREMEWQEAKNYYDLHLVEETSRYVFRLLALKAIIGNPPQFGFQIDDQDKYPPLNGYRTVAVTTSIPDLRRFAREQGTTYRMLKVYNPWLISNQLANSRGKTYEIKILVK